MSASKLSINRTAYVLRASAAGYPARYMAPDRLRLGSIVKKMVLVAAMAWSSCSALACSLTYSQLQAEAITVLRSKYPKEAVALGRAPDVVKLGGIELGLQNLRSKFCLPPIPDAAARRAEMEEYFERTVSLTKQLDVQIPTTWDEARPMIRVQLMHADYLRPFNGRKVLVTRPLVGDVHLAAVFDRPSGYAYVREEDRAKWKIEDQVLFETGLKNVDTLRKSAKLQGGAKPDPFLASEEKDGYDAVRLLLPWVREEAAKHLGDPFLAAVPNRDFLVMWGVGNSAGFQARARENVAMDFAAQPYKLSARVLKVWASGRIELAE